MGKFSEDVLDKIKIAERIIEKHLELINDRRQQLESDLSYWEGEYNSADDEEDDVGYFAYKRDEAAEKLDLARHLQEQVEEAYHNFSRYGRKVTVIAEVQLPEAQAFLRQKNDELREYVGVDLKGTTGNVSPLSTQASDFSTSQSTVDITTKETQRLTNEAITKRYDEISRQGHSVQKHGEEITEEQLDNRVMYGISPNDDTGNQTSKGIYTQQKPPPKNATKFTSKRAIVTAEEYIRNSQEYIDSLTDAIANDKDFFVINNIKLESIWGADYKNQVFGKTRVGTISNPIRTKFTDFTNGRIKAVFERREDKWNLLTIYPTPN